MKPEVSVVIPTRDRADVVETAINSCLDQDAMAVEVIVVADGSTPEQAKSYEDRVARAGCPVRLLYEPAVNGPAAARNRGIAAATGRHLVVLDDDNLLLPGMLVAQHELVAGDPDVVAVCGVEIVRPGAKAILECPSAMAARSLANDADPLSVVRPRAFWATFYAPTQLIRDVGAYDESIWFGEHTELLLRLLDRARFATRAEIGARVYRHFGLTHASRGWERKAEGTRRIMELHAARFARMPEVKARWLDVLGMTYLRLGDRRQARAAFVESVRTKPSGRGLVHLAGVATGADRWLAPGGGESLQS